tara:strand:- start:64 stop:1236 length:1173 start_codon:yes stop_codon:yes gene_type:complete
MIIGEICNNKIFNKKFYLQKNLYTFLSNKYKKFYFINVFYIFNKKKVKKFNFYKKNIIIFNPKNIKELNDFLKKDKIFLINNLSIKFKHILIHYLLSKKNIFQISFLNVAIFSNYKIENWDHANIKQKIYFIFKKRFSLIIYRILIILKILNQINILYVAQKKVFLKYSQYYNKKSLFRKRYKNILKTNIKFPLLKKFKKNKNSYLVFIDSNILHPEYIKRGQRLVRKDLQDYFYYLKTYLVNLQKLFKKKIVICLHPSSNLKLYKKNLGNFKMYKYQTDKYIMNSFILLFHDTSSIFSGILLKKKIIHLKSTIMGTYANKRAEFYTNKIKFVCHDIEKQHLIDKKRLVLNLKNNLKKYDVFLNRLYFFKNDSLSIEKLLAKEIQKFGKK